ncbi:L-histidine N(alpha)-methyltransferase [Streptomyces netropsis]|uniref:L-histidine N-alpha-methyltransferase n=1 Tax=Streptomyces netropsis TaxID=55404 RepID=A0A7W7PG23_STRNE|nr:L-histidine N(alpha)-methyltransferase [Streptomyces netropsis]MBB4887300.1 L-histidine N-alpha-methyltransferase [Streptomyces netropsis]GGR09309.1 histidine N-alpha-methyltransferase [Streptomyces netropsis]
MTLPASSTATLDTAVAAEHREMLRALTGTPKRLATKWLYDARGSALYTAIAQQPEYYLDEAEWEIVARRGADIAARTRARTLVDLGAGSGRKTRLLLDALRAEGCLKQYVPVDVSDSALRDAERALRADHPQLDIQPRVADFTAPLGLDSADAPVLLTLFGATYGNFRPDEGRSLLTTLRTQLRPGDGLLLGTDLVKDEAVLTAAYDDRAGVTAAFAKNGLTVLNRKLGANFRLGDFDHDVTWNPRRRRIENALRARRSHTVTLAALDRVVSFTAGERLHVGISAKFCREGVASELAAAGLRLDHWWTDSAHRYAVSLASVADGGAPRR